MELSTYKGIQKSKLRQFREKLTEHLWLLGYTIIVLSYLKYGGNIIIFLLRCFFQSVLANPFPDHDEVVRQLLFTGNVHSVPGSSLEDGRSGTGSNSDANNDEQQRTARAAGMAIDVIVNMQRALFHGVFTLNWLIVIVWILFPTDYESKIENFKYDGYPALLNTPSPYNNDNFLIQGEWRGTWFFQFIGESIPTSNITGNIMAIVYQFMIFAAQFTLYVLTCVHFSPLRKSQLSEEDEHLLMDNDSYENGNINIITLNPGEALKFVHNQDSSQQTDRRNVSPSFLV
ncbi:HDL023Cp [Eremothecium sinecaudum]|uniref:HDL023Cp n=1 Tax=Eremothecium sinecaudum TaxID=45286 RepID=A0A0X8HSN4_9SACH|nr:HDL023Cp [Eremothecium sinecaudum]AMD20721.1 HDL023Cp [Eremothecium sinecaudum]